MIGKTAATVVDYLYSLRTRKAGMRMPFMEFNHLAVATLCFPKLCRGYPRTAKAPAATDYSISIGTLKITASLASVQSVSSISGGEAMQLAHQEKLG